MSFAKQSRHTNRHTVSQPALPTDVWIKRAFFKLASVSINLILDIVLSQVLLCWSPHPFVIPGNIHPVISLVRGPVGRYCRPWSEVTGSAVGLRPGQGGAAAQQVGALCIPGPGTSWMEAGALRCLQFRVAGPSGHRLIHEVQLFPGPSNEKRQRNLSLLIGLLVP